MPDHCLDVPSLTKRHRTVRVWDYSTGAALHVLGGHADELSCLRLCADIAVSGAWDNTLRFADAVASPHDMPVCSVWDVVRGKLLYTLRGHSEGAYACDAAFVTCAGIFCVATHGTSVASGSADGSVRVWGMLTGELLLLLAGHTAEVVRASPAIHDRSMM